MKHVLSINALVQAWNTNPDASYIVSGNLLYILPPVGFVLIPINSDPLVCQPAQAIHVHTGAILEDKLLNAGYAKAGGGWCIEVLLEGRFSSEPPYALGCDGLAIITIVESGLEPVSYKV